MDILARSRRNLDTIPGYPDLPKREKELIDMFSILWPLCEERCFQTRANPKKIYEFSHSSSEVGPEVQACYDYFRIRYTQGPKAIERLEALCPGGGGCIKVEGRPALTVKDALQNFFASDPTDVEKLRCVLLVVYRLRNNLYHGTKLATLSGQEDNFRHALAVANWCIEQIPR
jgi:hypothetical protein